MIDKNRKPSTDNEPVFALGRQLTLEYYDCDATALLDKDHVESCLLKAADDSGATIISSAFHKFEPQGVSGVVIIAESHFTIHAWPEHNYAAVDIFTCGDNINLNTAIQSLKESFGADNVVISSDQNRGLLTPPGHPQNTAGGKTVADASKTLPISWHSAWEKRKPWGVSTTVDLYGCDLQKIGDAQNIRLFVAQLCLKLKEKQSGECRISRFEGREEGGGLAVTQLLENSLISGHFADEACAAYLDLFSCSFYEPREVAEFALSFFKADHYKLQISLRQ